MSVTLIDIKEALRVDFSDHDAYLSGLLEGEIERAEKATGIDSADFSQDINNGITKAVESMYVNRTDVATADLSTSTLIYRRNMKSPML